MPTNKSFFKQILIWRYKYISERQFVYALSVLVGLLAGLGTAVLKNLTFFFESVLEGKFIKDFHYSLYFIFPIIGLVLVYYIKIKVIKKEIGHGISTTLHAVSKRQGIIDSYKIYASLITAPITVCWWFCWFARSCCEHRCCFGFNSGAIVSYECKNQNFVNRLCNCWGHVINV